MQRRYANGAGQQEKRTAREGKVGVGGGVGCGRDGFGGGGVDNFVVQQQRMGTRGLPTGQGVWRKSGILGGTTGETAQRLPHGHAIRGQAAQPSPGLPPTRRGCGLTPSPSPPPIHRHSPSHSFRFPWTSPACITPLQSSIPPYVHGWTCLSDSGWTTT